MTKHQRVRWAGAASMLAAMALATSSLPALAADNDALDVSGTSIDVIELSIVVDSSAAFGNMTPDGAATTEATTNYTDTDGACYVWDNGANNVQVRSTVTYDLEVAVTGVDRTGLLFSQTAATDLASCESGTAVTTGALDGDLDTGNVATTGDLYNSHLKVPNVNWTAATFSVDTQITFTATSS